MNKNGLDIQSISSKQAGFQADRILLLEKVTKKKEKADPSQNQKSRLFASLTNISRS